MARWWRDYVTPAGRRPVKEYLKSIPTTDRVSITAAMADVAHEGLTVARHLRGDIYEVRAEGQRQSYRVLFSAEGKNGHVLLSLEAFSKKTQKTPLEKIHLAERRLKQWRGRGQK